MAKQPGNGARNLLVPDRLGALELLFFVLGAAAPLASTAGGTSTGWAVTGVTGIPISFLVTAVLLLVFLGGYAAMSRYVINAGAIYTFVSRGLGRVPGIGAAFVALLAYAAMQIGLFGGIGAVAAGFLDPRLGIEMPWWGYASVAWLVILICGRRRVEVNSHILGILTSAECLLLLIFDAIMLTRPQGGRTLAATLSLTNLTESASWSRSSSALLHSSASRTPPTTARRPGVAASAGRWSAAWSWPRSCTRCRHGPCRWPRYVFALGRDGVLPAVLGVAPHRRTGQRGDRWRRPGAGRDRHRSAGAVVSVLGLGLVVALTLTQYATLLGVPAGSPVTWRLPSLLAAAFALGVPRAGYLRARQRRRAPPLLAAGTDLTGR